MVSVLEGDKGKREEKEQSAAFHIKWKRAPLRELFDF